MEDIASALLELLRKRFLELVSVNPKIRAPYKRIMEGKATYADAGEYAYLVGKALSQTFGENLSSAVLPDGRMYYNIADRVLRPLMEEDYGLISDAARMVQTAMNENAGIGIKAQTAAVNTDRIDGIINKVSNAEAFDDVAWVLDAPVVNFSQAVVEDTIRANVNLQGKAGLQPKIIRKAEPACCKWCADLAGEYDYPNVPDDVYRRHENCRCTVEYDPGDGRRQNVHTKKWTIYPEDAKIEARKIIGLRTNGITITSVSDHALERIQERAILMEDILDAIRNPLKVNPIKTDDDGRRSFCIIGSKATVYINPDSGQIATTHKTHSKTAKKLKKK